MYFSQLLVEKVRQEIGAFDEFANNRYISIFNLKESSSHRKQSHFQTAAKSKHKYGIQVYQFI
jgi:hypothetical protein